MLPFQMIEKAEREFKSGATANYVTVTQKSPTGKVTKVTPSKVTDAPRQTYIDKNKPSVQVSKNTVILGERKLIPNIPTSKNLEPVPVSEPKNGGYDISILNPNFRLGGLEKFVFPFNLIPDFKGTIDTKTGSIDYSTDNLTTPSANEIILNPSLFGHDAKYGTNIPDDVKKNVEKVLEQQPSITQPFKDLPKLPDFGDIGKWVLIGGGLLLAILILPKLIPQRR